jgi:hypothetical protein
MKLKTKQKMYNKFSIIDIFVIIVSLIAFVALIFIVNFYNDKSSNEQEQLSETGSIYRDIKSDNSLYGLSKLLTINEVNGSGWIELYNKENDTRLDMSNCYVTVNGIKKYIFPEGEFVEADDYFCVEGLGQLGTTENDVIGIFDKNGKNLKDIMLPKLTNEESYGCRTEGDFNYYHLTASKMKSNSESSIIKKDKLTFSVPGGFYDENFLLNITAAEGMTIYYTLDGKDPTTRSEVYTEPILIENKSGSDIRYATAEGIYYIRSYKPSSISIGMVVRAIAVDSRGISSEIETQSYFIGIKDSNDIKNIPVLSITTAPENLFDYFEGIYVTGRSHEDALARGEDGYAAANYLNGWKRNVNVEYFEPQKDKTFEGKMTVSIINDYNVRSPQKSLLLSVERGVFAGSSLMDYYSNTNKQLVVQSYRMDNIYKIREYLAGKLLAATTVGTPEIIPCIVFINGEYWGGYMLSAVYDERYIAKHYDVDEDEVIIAENGGVINNLNYQRECNELYNFIYKNDLKDNENYKWVKDHLDIQNYLEYLCANMYLANAQYGFDKLVMWRTIKEQGAGYDDGKWRFLMPRLDNTMKNVEAGDIATSSINTFLQNGLSKDLFFQSLIRNDEFKEQLRAVMTHMADDTFAKGRVEASICEISTQMKKMVEVSYRRFVGYPGEFFYSNEVDKIESFFQQRKTYILRYTEEVISQGGISNVGDNAISE